MTDSNGNPEERIRTLEIKLRVTERVIFLLALYTALEHGSTSHLVSMGNGIESLGTPNDITDPQEQELFLQLAKSQAQIYRLLGEALKPAGKTLQQMRDKDLKSEPFAKIPR